MPQENFRVSFFSFFSLAAIRESSGNHHRNELGIDLPTKTSND